MVVGSNYLGSSNCEFTLWAPLHKKVELKIVHPFEGLYPMFQDDDGYWRLKLEGINPGTQYLYRIDESNERPDPASNFQPFGVHGPSQVVDHLIFPWEDEQWSGIQVPKLIIYELHIGTFTDEGTFESAIKKIDHLVELGITAIEIMPVAQFPGSRNWGYDGVYPYAPQNSYGGPKGLKKLVSECHKRKIAVILDVVYNHLGPEGNYLREFGPYFTDKYRTPWGDALNFDDAYSDAVRNYFLENARYWFTNFHIDGLRLDAVDKIYDLSAKHILRELAENTEALNMATTVNHFLIAESDLNDEKIIRPLDLHGYGLDSQWSDDFHHSLHSLLTGEREGYYSDFGSIKHLQKALQESFYYSGVYSEYRKRRHGNSATDRPPYKFVICIQNHDQVGNRAFGERISNLVSFEALKIAAGIMFLSPYIPLIFMGEEYAERNPFLYFVDHSDADLMESVKHGRRDEFRSFNWKNEVPDPTKDNTFLDSKLNWELKEEEQNSIMFHFIKYLISCKKKNKALINTERRNSEFTLSDNLIFMRRWSDQAEVFGIFNFNENAVNTKIKIPSSSGYKLIDSADEKWLGKGSGMPDRISNEDVVQVNELSFTLYELKSSM